MPTGISAWNTHVSVPELPQPSLSCHTVDHGYSTLEHLAASLENLLLLQFDVCSLDQPFRYRGWKPRNKCGKQVAKLDYSRHRGRNRPQQTLKPNTKPQQEPSDGRQEGHQEDMHGHAWWWLTVDFVLTWQIMNAVSQDITDQSPRITRETSRNLNILARLQS